MLIYLANIHITTAFKVKTIYLAVVKIFIFLKCISLLQTHYIMQMLNHFRRKLLFWLLMNISAWLWNAHRQMGLSECDVTSDQSLCTQQICRLTHYSVKPDQTELLLYWTPWTSTRILHMFRFYKVPVIICSTLICYWAWCTFIY